MLSGDKMKIEILKQENTYVLPSQEEFKKDIYYAPLVRYVKKVEYTIGNISFTDEIFLDSARAKVHVKSLWQYERDNDIYETTREVIIGAMSEAMQKNRPYKALQSKSQYNEYQCAINKSVELIKSSKEVVMLHDVKDKPVNEINKFRTYLYYYLGPIIFKHGCEDIDIEKRIMENLAFGILNLLREESYDLNTVDGNLEYIEYLCDYLGYCSKKAVDIAKETKKITILMEYLNEKGELEDFLTENVPEVEIIDAFECYEVGSVTDLYNEHKGK